MQKAMELVIFDAGHILPLFVFKAEKKYHLEKNLMHLRRLEWTWDFKWRNFKDLSPNLPFRESDSTSGLIRQPYQLIPVFENGSVINSERFNAFKRLLPDLNNFAHQLIKVTYIQNKRLEVLFNIMREIYYAKMNLGQHMNRDWKNQKPTDLKEFIFGHLMDKLGVFASANETDKPPQAPVIPMLQGTDPTSAHRISQHGFGIVAGRDQGWFGCGIYFTSDLEYALFYASQHPSTPSNSPFASPSSSSSSNSFSRSPSSSTSSSDDEDENISEVVVLLSYVIPGNPYPITEYQRDAAGYLGKSVRSGYQSHYTLVFKKSQKVQGAGIGTPIKEKREFNPAHVADELVVFNGGQTLPLYILHFKVPNVTQSRRDELNVRL